MKKFHYILLILFPILTFIGCSDEELFDTNDKFILNYKVSVADDAKSRAVGDGTNVDQLIVGIFEETDEEGDIKYKKLENLFFDKEEGKNTFDACIPLFRNKTYSLVFWAQKKENKVYDTNDLSNIQIDYSKISEMSLDDAMSLDAFSIVKTGITANATSTPIITLERPFTMISTGANGGSLEDIKTAELTLSKVYTSYQPLAGTVSDPKENVTLSFNEFGNNTFEAEGETFNYLTVAFLLVNKNDSDVTISGSFKDEAGEAISTIEEYTVESLEVNYRNHIGKPLTEGWDGTRVDKLVPDENDGIIHIANASQLLYLLENGYNHQGNGSQKFHLCKDLDMKKVTVNRSTEYALKNIEFDGGGFTLYNLPSSLFGESEGLMVSDLTLKKAEITSGSINGALAVTVKGSASFTNVIVEKSIVSATDIVGGIVGYISRINEKNRSESLEVTFDNCHVKSTELSASIMGKMVGELSGYDNNEVLAFSNTCTVADDVDVQSYSSPYIAANQSVWLETIDSKYNGWLGTERYRRGVVTFDGKRLVPKWDGMTTIEPLLANATYDSGTTVGSNKYVVYSPYDLAGVRKITASPSAIYLRTDIDMNGQGSDGGFNVPNNFTNSANASADDNNFNPFNYVTTLDGKKSDNENYNIYNLAITQLQQERAAFILYASGTTSHKNINFRNCQTVAVHKVVTTDAKAYGAILVSNVDATYTMENVHAYDCKVFALQKVGTLGARISGTSTLTNNSVNNCYVENYECNITERFSSGEKTIGSWKVTVYADFYPHGEVGGMYGFIQGNSTLTGCKVNGTTIYAFGQDDKMATTSGSLLARLGIAALGYYKVPGRHVCTLIGNIRATGTVTLTGCTVDTNSKCTNRYDKHNSTYTYIGQAYIVKFVDSEGTVTVDGKKLTIADCNKNTKL